MKCLQFVFLLVVLVVVGFLLECLFVLVSFVAFVCWLLGGGGGVRVLIGCFRLLVDGCASVFVCVMCFFAVFLCFLCFVCLLVLLFVLDPCCVMVFTCWTLAVGLSCCWS